MESKSIVSFSLPRRIFSRFPQHPNEQRASPWRKHQRRWQNHQAVWPSKWSSLNHPDTERPFIPRFISSRPVPKWIRMIWRRHWHRKASRKSWNGPRNDDWVWNSSDPLCWQQRTVDPSKSARSEISKRKVRGEWRSFGSKTSSICVEFKKQTEEKLQKKLEAAKENRERALQAKVEKAKAPIEKGLATVHQNLAKLEEERQLLQEKITQKLSTAETSKIGWMVKFDSSWSLPSRSSRTTRSSDGEIGWTWQEDRSGQKSSKNRTELQWTNGIDGNDALVNPIDPHLIFFLSLSLISCDNLLWCTRDQFLI